MTTRLLPAIALFLFMFLQSAGADTNSLTVRDLGRSLFFDKNISLNRTQSCATCHAPDRGFSDHRGEGAAAAASLGDDGKTIGDRNAPTATYAAYTPLFSISKEGVYKGGQFLDGRASDLETQAGGPPLNPAEMGMPDKSSVVTRLLENPYYETGFKSIFGKTVFEDSDVAYEAMTKAIAEFERSNFFSPFDSKYDRSLNGDYSMTEQEELGMTLFFSEQFTNCNTCHQLSKTPSAQKETFSNYEFHNIGIPENVTLRAINGVAEDFIDEGLLSHPDVHDPAQKGKFKTPTLRNVAVTEPYMHNGVFKNLRTVILYYNKYNSRSEKRHINPETGKQWAAPEVPETISIDLLESGPALTDKRIDALVAFMKTLTDKKYEHLLK